MLRYSFKLLEFPSKKFSNPVVTHDVLNQAPFFENYNSYKMWPRLGECIRTYKADAYEPKLVELGKKCGSAYWLNEAHLANKTEPIFVPFDRQGRRVDQVQFVESYHRLMKLRLEYGMANVAYKDKQHGHVAEAALFNTFGSMENGTSCPVTMTTSGIISLLGGGPFFQPWIDKLSVPDYDSRDIHVSLKTAATCGMSMTEKQGGSDVRENTTFAVPLNANDTSNHQKSGSMYRLTGHKWFTSAPMSDCFLTLAYSGPGELSCFLVPRWISPTERNVGLRFQRLKNKMGDKSNASSEVEYNDAVGYLVGEAGQGVKTIIKMVNHTRLLCIVNSSSVMAGAVSNAIHHCTYRRAFGGTLADKPIMQNVLTDLCLEVEAGLALGSRVAHSFDEGSNLSKEYRRLAVAVGKYTVCKRSPSTVYEAMECMGGNGYLEDFPLARLFKQSPLSAIWEGSGNVIVLDVFRTLQKMPKALQDVAADVRAVDHPAVNAEMDRLLFDLKQMTRDDVTYSGRRIVERLGVLLQCAALFHSNGDAEVLGAFIASRVGNGCQRGVQYGTLEAKLVNPMIIKRNTPQIETKM